MMSREERMGRLRAMRDNGFAEPERKASVPSGVVPSGDNNGGVASDRAAALIAEALKTLLRSS